jgi:glycogen debranching enzyme
MARMRARQRFLVKDAGFNALHALDLRAMEQLARAAGDDPAPYAQRRRRVADAMLDRWEREDGFRAPWPVPTVERRDLSFYPGQTPFLWRGPVWSFVNWFLYRVLRARGLPDEAKALRDSLSALVQRSGFGEYYDPLSGRGHGAQDFTWAGLLLDMD